MDSFDKNIYGLIGYPLGHSFSQDFFNKKFEAENINARYINFELRDIEEFPSVIARHPNLQGLNVTIPYKQQVMKYLDRIDDKAETIGAVNVIKIVRSGKSVKLIGYNSDCIGFVDSISAMIKPTHRKALVLGTGGASKAVAYGLRQLGVEPTYVSRTKAEGQYTYDGLRLRPEIVSEHTIIVNTTPLGMYPNLSTCPDIPYEYITADHLCYDVVYNPEVTTFMRKCAEAGAVTKNGLEMLLMQAFAAWSIWNTNQ